MRFLQPLLPQTHRFCDDAEFSPERVLTESLNTSGHENEIGRSSAILRHRVGTDEGDDAFPEADRRLGFVAFPAVVDLAEDAHVGSGLALGLTGEETAVSQVFAQKSGILEEIFAL